MMGAGSKGRSWLRGRRMMSGLLIVLTVSLPLGLGACQSATDRQASAGDAGTLPYPGCDDFGSAKTCILDANHGGPDFSQTVVLNGASVLFGDATGQPAGQATLIDTCWAPGDAVEATDCTSAGLTMPPGFATMTTVDGYPAVVFDAPKVPDTTGSGEEVYPLPGYVDVSVDGRTVRIEIACCEKI